MTIKIRKAAKSRDALARIWRKPTKPSKTKRAISRKSSGSGRALLESGGREVHCESITEYKAAQVLLADNRVAEIRHQEPEVYYRDAAGKVRKHIFDFRVVLKDGRTIPVAVRPERRAAPVRDIVRRIARQTHGVAHGFLVLTDKHLTRTAVHNAQMILFSRDGDPAADARIRAAAATLHGAMTIGGLITRSGCDGEGFRAVCRLIATGDIIIPKGARIGRNTLVSKAGGLN